MINFYDSVGQMVLNEIKALGHTKLSFAKKVGLTKEELNCFIQGNIEDKNKYNKYLDKITVLIPMTKIKENYNKVLSGKLSLNDESENKSLAELAGVKDEKSKKIFELLEDVLNLYELYY